MGKHRAGIRSSGSSHVTANILTAAKAIRRHAVSTTAVMKFITASVIMMQKSHIIIILTL